MLILKALSGYSLKTTETLLGIETKKFTAIAVWRWSLKTTETLLGIETAMSLDTVLYAFCLKTTETLLGIETDSTLLVMKIAAPLSQNY